VVENKRDSMMTTGQSVLPQRKKEERKAGCCKRFFRCTSFSSRVTCKRTYMRLSEGEDSDGGEHV
jgi:hypothetical protein